MPQSSAHNAVLAYHEVMPESNYAYCVTSAAFAEQLALFDSIAKAFGPGPSIKITFDDGEQSQFNMELQPRILLLLDWSVRQPNSWAGTNYAHYTPPGTPCSHTAGPTSSFPNVLTLSWNTSCGIHGRCSKTGWHPRSTRSPFPGDVGTVA
jgi:hypothetical protein